METLGTASSFASIILHIIGRNGKDDGNGNSVGKRVEKTVAKGRKDAFFG
ncbi:MAG: hypothetical protein Q4C06_07055 [Bacillota bacterium]|nr:hypothetical protein [Bacillota bacterium]